MNIQQSNSIFPVVNAPSPSLSPSIAPVSSGADRGCIRVFPNISTVSKIRILVGLSFLGCALSIYGSIKSDEGVAITGVGLLLTSSMLNLTLRLKRMYEEVEQELNQRLSQPQTTVDDSVQTVGDESPSIESQPDNHPI